VQVAVHLAVQTAVLVVRLVVVVRFQSPETSPSPQTQPFIAALEQVVLGQHQQTQVERLVEILGSTSSIQHQHQAQMQSLPKVAELGQTLALVAPAVLLHLDLEHTHIPEEQAERHQQLTLVVVAADLLHHSRQAGLLAAIQLQQKVAAAVAVVLLELEQTTTPRLAALVVWELMEVLLLQPEALEIQGHLAGVALAAATTVALSALVVLGV
jgi:hypothetical protein